MHDPHSRVVLDARFQKLTTMGGRLPKTARPVVSGVLAIWVNPFWKGLALYEMKHLWWFRWRNLFAHHLEKRQRSGRLSERSYLMSLDFDTPQER